MFFLSEENVMLFVLGRRIPSAEEKEEAVSYGRKGDCSSLYCWVLGSLYIAPYKVQSFANEG